MKKREDINQYLIGLGFEWFNDDKCSIFEDDDYLYRAIYDDSDELIYYRDYYISLLDDRIKIDLFKKFRVLCKSNVKCKCCSEDFKLRYDESTLNIHCNDCGSDFILFNY